MAAAKKKTDELSISIGLMPMADAQHYQRNARTHPQSQIDEIKASVRAFGYTYPILTDVDDGNVIAAGHGRHMALEQMYAADGVVKLPDGRELPHGMIPFIDCSGWTEEQRRAYTLADNKIAENSGWDDDILALEIGDLTELGSSDAPIIGFTDDELAAFTGEIVQKPVKGSLADRFGVPPFSVLNAREGWWQDRKRAWIALGIVSEVGRDSDLTYGSSDAITSQGLNHYRDKAAGKAKKVSPESYDNQERFNELMGGKGMSTGVSIFDPVLCELAYRWFSPEGGTVLDPFCGGSVRGIVAAKLGRTYHGIDLRTEQVKANVDQWVQIGDDQAPEPTWYEGDSINVGELTEGVAADFIFSCPPYGDLEVYSNDPADLSNMDYADFIAAYRKIIAASCEQLKPDSFACFVVGDIRDPKGNYRCFVNDTIDAFRAAGLELYNEAILITAVGSLPIRATKQFKAGRKLGKTHQNVLVFVKGTGKAATDRLGEVEFGKIEGVDDDWGEKL